MKILSILLLLCSFTLSAQNGDEFLDDQRYVWAESGLTLRAQGKSKADKIAVVPYGAKVTITGHEGGYVRIPVFKALTVSADIRSKAWSMEDAYLEVVWDGKTGWLYGGYLSRFPAPEPTDDFYQWLTEVGGKPVAVMTNVRMPDLGGLHSLYRYSNGITNSETTGESWGSGTVTIPLLTFNDGLLIADRFYGLSKSLKLFRSGEALSMDPLALLEIGESYLLFGNELSSVSIRRVGDMIIITSDGGC